MPRPARLALAAVALGGALAAACGGDDATSPDTRAPRAGRYAFAFSHAGAAGSGLPAASYAGTLTLTAATADQLTGTWAVPNVRPALGDGAWQVDAYRLVADPTNSAAQLIFRVRRGDGDALTCEGRATRVASSGLVSVVGPCTFTYQGR